MLSRLFQRAPKPVVPSFRPSLHSLPGAHASRNPPKITVFFVHGCVQEASSLVTAFKDVWEGWTHLLDRQLGEGLAHVSLSYDPRVEFTDAAKELAQGLKSVDSGSVVFVTHGCGGLVVRQSLVTLGREANDEAALSRVKAAAFISPMFGGFDDKTAAAMAAAGYLKPVRKYLDGGVIADEYDRLKRIWRWKDTVITETLLTKLPWNGATVPVVLEFSARVSLDYGLYTATGRDHFSIIETPAPNSSHFLVVKNTITSAY